MRWVLIIHAGATLMMTGLIWFVQVVHYPLMARAGRDDFARFEAAHTRRTTWVVAPLMLAEAATAAILALSPPPDVGRVAAGTGLGLLAVIWISTATLQVPMHQRLVAGFDERAHRRLLTTNWIRTIAWTVRGVMALSWLV